MRETGTAEEIKRSSSGAHAEHGDDLTLTFFQPVFDIRLPGVDGLAGLAAHVVDVGAEVPGPT